MSYKLIALDLDDTLLNSQGGISPHTLDVLQQARSRGCYPVIATGRSFAGAKRYYHLLGGNSPIIVLTGSEVLDENGQIIYKMHLENQDALHILRYAKERDLHAQIYVGNDYCFQKYSKYADLYEHFYGFPGKVLPDLYDRDVIDTPKIIYIAEIDTINQIREQIQEQFPHLHLMSSNPHYLEFLNPHTDKGRALKFLAEHLGIRREEVIACGDSQIDASMIEYAGLGVAVQNAMPEIKKIADIVTDSNDNEGVSHVVEEFVLKK